MDPSIAVAGNAFQLIEEFYPTFLAETGYNDTWLARVTFYKLIIESAQAVGLSDARAQSLLMSRLFEEQSKCQFKFQEEIFNALQSM